MAWFHCILGQGTGTGIPLIVECTQSFAGKTISCTDGTTTLHETCPSSSPYEVLFNLPNIGTWTISGVISGQTISTQVTVTELEAILADIPEGATVTPTDDIQIWLHCANIWDKNYTTISQVLSDTTTLLALISDTNAVDYMARSTTWATSVCANSTAMGYIGNNDYCANKLLANSTWRGAICNSTYFESVLNVKVPTMTSNTTPSGVVSASSNNASSSYDYQLFDGNTSTAWQSAVNTGNNSWIQYKFASAVKIYKFGVMGYSNAATSYIGKVQGSNDGNSWTDLTSDFTASNTSISYDLISNIGSYKYYRLQTIQCNWTQERPRVLMSFAQFYGRA